MAIVVMHTETEQNFVFLGTGYGSWATEKPGVFGFTDRKEGDSAQVYVSNGDGRILSMAPNKLVVISVDGVPVADVLGVPPASPELT